jgi:hypothetical protein
VVVEFYKTLFKEEGRGHFCIDNAFWEAEELVTPEERASLEAPYSEMEIKEVVFSYYLEGAPDPDGLYFMFYQ